MTIVLFGWAWRSSRLRRRCFCLMGWPWNLGHLSTLSKNIYLHVYSNYTYYQKTMLYMETMNMWMYMYIYIYVYVCMYIWVYGYIYIYLCQLKTRIENNWFVEGVWLAHCRACESGSRWRHRNRWSLISIEQKGRWEGSGGFLKGKFL